MLRTAASPVSTRPWLLKAASRLEGSRQFAESMDVLLEASQELGFTGVDYSYMPRCRLEGAWVSPPCVSRAFPEGWDRRWHRYAADDPYYHACTESRAWVDWREIQQRNNLTRRERDAISYLADFGIVRGITIPIRLQGDELAFVSGIGEPSLEREAAAERLLALAHYFHLHLEQRRFLRDWHGAPGPLTAREIECLAWAARGKTAQDSAAILERSADTVRIHLKHAIAKLGACNIAHAVAKGLALGLIESE